MSTEFFRNYINVITEAEQVDIRRRGFLVGLASFAAEIGMGSPVIKLLSTPAGIAALPVAAAIALLKGIQKHLDQFDADDDDDYIESQEEMADALGFVEKEGNDGFDNSGTDQLTDLLDLYDKNPELAAAQLTKHLQGAAINPPDVQSSFKSRADDPNDWRYNNKMASDASDPNTNSPMNIANISRSAGMAKGINSASNQEPNTTVEPTGSIQPAKNTIALPAPTKPEFDLTPNFKSKEKVPVRRNGLSESTELSSILKNAGLKLGQQR
jgi:hypothetical protein